MPGLLVGCERSGTVTATFVARGIDAWSCDTSPAEPGHPCPERHLVCDVRDALACGPWRGLIVHPTCTYLCASGLHWNKRGRIEADGRPRAAHTADALEFVRYLFGAIERGEVERLALENPTGCIGSQIRKATQYVQPYQYGHNASKATGLWLDGLPALAADPAQYVAPRAVCPACTWCGRGDLAALAFAHGCLQCGAEPATLRPRWANQTDSGQNALGPSATRWMDRSRTYPGIAAAMAEQWAPLLVT